MLETSIIGGESGNVGELADPILLGGPPAPGVGENDDDGRLRKGAGPGCPTHAATQKNSHRGGKSGPGRRVT